MKRALLIAALFLIGAADRDPLAFVGLDGDAVQFLPWQQDGALVLHFWATWCPTCLAEMQALDSEAAACSERSVHVVAVNVGEDEQTVRRYWADHEFKLPIVRDSHGREWRRMGGAELPINWVWSRAKRRTLAGPRDAEAWRGLLTELGCDRSRTS